MATVFKMRDKIHYDIRHTGEVVLTRAPCRSRFGSTFAITGWAIFAHSLFLAQLESLGRQVQALQQKDPGGYAKKNASKRLAAIVNLAFNIIPQDPSRPEYRQGGTLGEDRKHWFRAKFFQQYRLFFRHHAAAKIIVFAY